MANAPHMQNTNGVANNYLNGEARKNGAATAVGAAVRQAPKSQQMLVSSVLNAVRAEILDSDTYQRRLDSRTTDVILGRIATLLDQYKADFASDELAAAKKEILSKIDSLSFDSILKSIIVTGISQLFDDRATRDDIEELKEFLVDLYSQQSSDESTDVQNASDEVSGTEQAEETSQDVSGNENAAEEAEPETVGDYSDDTVAQNFSTLQNFIDTQVQMLNDTIAKISNAGFGSKIAKMVSNGFKRTAAVTSQILHKVKSMSGTVLSIGKNVAGAAMAGLMKTVGFIAGSVSSIGKGIGAAMAGVKGLAGNIAGFGKKIGGAIMSPFKKIGGLFNRKKKDKSASRKEAMKEKFMNFMMSMFEKLWSFLEPILTKLKVFMLLSLMPVLTTFMTVLAIIAAVTLLIVGLVVAYMFVKNVLIPKIKKIFLALGKKLKDFCIMCWNGIKKLGEWIWYIISFKWLVDFGKWLWKKLCEFGQWIMDTFIRPYIIDPLKKVLDPVMKKLQPFIDSLKSLVQRIRSIWKNFHWDESKSFFDNLKCLASIVKDAVLDWWETSPFKVFYETYLEPIILSVQDLIARIQNIWANFKWDENLSFCENLMVFWNQVKAAIIEWWNGSIIKTYWDKLTDWLSNVWQKVKDWWNSTSLGKWVNGTLMPAIAKIVDWLQTKIESIKNKLADMSFTIPAINPDSSWRKPSTWFMWKTIKPFGFFASKQTESSATKIIGNTDSGEDFEKDVDNAKDIPRQQVNNAMSTVNSISNMNQQTNVQLQQTGEEMSQRVQADKAATQTFQDQQSLLGSQTLAAIGSLSTKVDKYGKDPSVVPYPVPYGQQQNPAMMED